MTIKKSKFTLSIELDYHFTMETLAILALLIDGDFDKISEPDEIFQALYCLTSVLVTENEKLGINEVEKKKILEFHDFLMSITNG